MKFDFLGLTTLTILNKCVEYINKLHPGQSFELRRIPTDDPATLKLFQDGDTTAVFQFESPGMRQLLRQAHPDRIEDLVALNALYRPGPMEMIRPTSPESPARNPSPTSTTAWAQCSRKRTASWCIRNR